MSVIVKGKRGDYPIAKTLDSSGNVIIPFTVSVTVSGSYIKLDRLNFIILN